MNNYNWENLLISPLRDLLAKVFTYIPIVISAVVIFIIGLIVAKILGAIAKKIFEYSRVDHLSEKIGLKKEMEKIGFHFTFAGLIGGAVKWFFIILTLITVADILQISQVNAFLSEIALYLPNVLAAVVILSIGLLAGRFFAGVIKDILASFTSAVAANLVSAIAKWAIYVFSIMAALVQLKIAVNLIQILLIGLSGLIALSGGLAFGLGGKDKAREVLEDISSRMRQK